MPCGGSSALRWTGAWKSVQSVWVCAAGRADGWYFDRKLCYRAGTDRVRTGDGYRGYWRHGKSLQELGGLLLISDAGGFWGRNGMISRSGRRISASGRKKKRNLGRKRRKQERNIRRRRRKKAESGKKRKKKIKKMEPCQKCRKIRRSQTGS